MRKLWIALIVLLLTGVFSSTAAANPDRPVIAILPVVNNAAQKNTGYIVDMINDSLYNKFGQDRYLVLGGQYLLDNFRREGVDDPRSLDRATLNAMLDSMRVDYYVRAEILPISTRQRVDFPDIFLFMKTWIASVPFSCTVTNVHTGAVVYEFTYSDYGKHEAIIGFANRDYAIRIALTKVLEKFERETIVLD